MKLNRMEFAGVIAAIMLAILAGVFFVTQSIAHAMVDGEEITCDVVFPNFPWLDQCDEGGNDDGNGGVENPPVDACDDIINHIPGMNCDGDDGDDDGNGGGDGGGNGGGDGGGNGGGGDGGGGGGGTPACSDGFDNDQDGAVDLDDHDCTDIYDNDEAGAPAENSSGGGGGGGSGSGGYTATSTGEVLGTTTPNVACDAYLTAFIKFGAKNDEEQVKRLQHVLKNFEGAKVEENGVYDEATLSAVHAFQTKYWDTILAPWNIKQSTGFVYLTTRKKVNEIYCANKPFPLSAAENALIEKTKKPYTSTVVPKATSKPAVKAEEKPAAEVKTTPTATGSSSKSPVSSPIRDFFRRLFNRGR